MRPHIIHIAICASFGVFVGVLHAHAATITLFSFLLGVIYLFFFIYAQYKKQTTIISLFIIVCSFSFCIGAMRGIVYEKRNISYMVYQEKVTFRGEVISPSQIQGDIQKVIVHKVEMEDTQQGEDMYIQLSLPLYPRVYTGDILSVSGKIEKGDVILPDFPHTRSSFDYGAYLLLHDIDGTMHYPHIEIVGHSKENTLRNRLFSFREKMTEKIYMYIPKPESALAEGVLLGGDSFDTESKDVLRSAGLTHIVVLSGFNIAVLIACSMYIFAFTPLLFRIIFSGTLITFFVIATGGGASLLRAALMSFLSLLFLFLGRGYNALQALFFSLFVYVMYIPEALISDVSLHLSFLATFAVVVLRVPVYEVFSLYYFFGKRGETFKELCATTVAVVIFTTPYILYTFSQLSPYALLANMLVVPLIPLLMLCVFLLLCFSFVPLVAPLLAFVVYVISSYVFAVASFISSLPYARLEIHFSLSMMLYVYTVLFFVYFAYTAKLFDKKKEEMSFETISDDGAIVHF